MTTPTPRTAASEFLLQVNRLQISLMIRDPYVADAFRRAEDDGLAPALAASEPPTWLGGGAAVIVPAAGHRVVSLVEV